MLARTVSKVLYRRQLRRQHHPSRKRFLEPATLDKRFFEIPADPPGRFVIELLKKRYTTNLSPDPTRCEWHAYEPTKQYASAIKGLSDCTAVFVTSPKGMFSAHRGHEHQRRPAIGELRRHDQQIESRDLGSQGRSRQWRRLDHSTY